MLKHAMDVKVNVRPIFSNVVHTAVWECPCRVGRPEILSPEYESRAGKEEFKSRRKGVRQKRSPESHRRAEPSVFRVF